MTCVYALRTDRIGLPIFADGRQIACGVESVFQTSAEPRGFWDRTQWRVVYSVPEKLLAVSLDAAGLPSGTPLTIASEGSAFDPFAVATPRGLTILYNRVDVAGQ